MIFECFVYPTIIKHLYSSTKKARKIRSRVLGYAEEAAHILGTNSLSIISQLLTQNTVILIDMIPVYTKEVLLPSVQPLNCSPKSL